MPVIRLPDGTFAEITVNPGVLATYLGWPEFDAEQEATAAQHVQRAVDACWSYTRGKGFHDGGAMEGEIYGVVLALAARSMANPTGDSRISAGVYSASPGQPEFTLGDRLTLDRWRRRAAAI